MDNNELLKAIGEMIDGKLGEIQSELKGIKEEQGNIKNELKEFRTETNERFDAIEDKFDVLDAKNTDNHIVIKRDVHDLREAMEEIEVDLKMIKKITVVNSEDIEKLTLVK